MKRVYVYRNMAKTEGKLMALVDSLEEFTAETSSMFQLPKEDIRFYTQNGCEIHDLRLVRDEDKLYLSLERNEESQSGLNIDNSLGQSSTTKAAETVQKKTVSDWITLNIGGRHFTTSRATLLGKEPLSMLARMFADDNNVYLMTPSATDCTGAFMIDRSPEYFEPILNYLRHGNVVLDNHVNPKGVLEEAVFYGIDSMIPHLNLLIEELKFNGGNHHALTRMDVVRSIITTPITAELRFQGVNLAGADLNRLDLRLINFKYACLSRCNLSGANLSHCCLERADLSHANLEGAQLLGVKALCANMEGGNLKGCNMEDPAGSRAIMEGVNLKGANLEGSNMAGVNLRVATLKNANLQNCDLRAAVLAGADLECCDLSGSDLHEANLRGANLKDAAFELMLTPLHMSQTIR